MPRGIPIACLGIATLATVVPLTPLACAVPDTGLADAPDAGHAAAGDADGPSTEDGGIGSGANAPDSATAGIDSSTTTPDASTDPAGWTLTWSDEFDGANGSAIDETKWNYDVGVGEEGWGNDELEYYTSGTANAVLHDGSLVITATPDGAAKLKCAYGACKYVSARITTSGKFAQQYGRFEARIRVPRGRGVWPAFWMLGQDFPGVDWPACGEIDIMENIGSEPAVVHGTTHGPGPAKYVDVGLTGSATLANGSLADDFHVYAAEWEASAIRFYFDGTLYKTVTPADVPSGAKWVWQHPYFLLLNFAVGGEWPGPPDDTTVWPQTMTIDYVRVYRATSGAIGK